MLSGSLLLVILVAAWTLVLFVEAGISLFNCICIWRRYKKDTGLTTAESLYIDRKAVRVGICATDVMICLLVGLYVITSLVLTYNGGGQVKETTPGTVALLVVNVGILVRIAALCMWPICLIRSRRRHLRGTSIADIPPGIVQDKEVEDTDSSQGYTWSEVFKSRAKSLITWVFILHVTLLVALYFESMFSAVQTTTVVEIQLDLQSSPRLLTFFEIVAIKQAYLLLVGVTGTACIAWAVQNIRMRIRARYMDGGCYQTENCKRYGSQDIGSSTPTVPRREDKRCDDVVILTKSAASDEDDGSWCTPWRDYLFPWIPLLANLVYIHFTQTPDVLVLFWAYSCVTCCLSLMM